LFLFGINNLVTIVTKWVWVSNSGERTRWLAKCWIKCSKKFEASRTMKPGNALEYLQAVYRGDVEGDPKRMQAAKAAIDFETPKLSVVASVQDDGTFAERLDRALKRSAEAKLIEHRADEKVERPMRRPR
jgi:hypothetical protein